MPGTGRQLEPVYRWLGATMTELRETKGLSQTEVARRMGLDPSTVMHWEQGRNRVKMHAFLAWCRTVGVDPADVISRVLQETAETGQNECRDKPKT